MPGIDLHEAMIATIERTPDPVLITDGGGIVVFANDAARSVANVDPGAPLDLAQFSDGTSDRVLHEAMPAARRDGIWSGEIVLKSPSGVTRAMTMVLVCRRNEEGAVHFYSAILHDVSDMQAQMAAARDRAEQADRSKSQFLANMSHELKTPLNAILNYAQIIREDAAAAGLDQSVDDLARIETSSQHLLMLVEDILDYSEIELGNIHIESGEIDLELFLDPIIEFIAPMARRRDNTLEINLDPGLGRFRTDARRLRQCLVNLLDNACKFTEGGIIRLTVQRNQRELSIVIEDSGIGMSEEQLLRAFMPFEQADMSNTRRFGGTGLGLVLTKTFTELMGGTLTIDSTLGAGSTFAMHFPI